MTTKTIDITALPQCSMGNARRLTVVRKSISEVLFDIKPDDEGGFLKHRLLSLAYDADIVLDLHCDLQASVHIYTGTPLWPDAADLSAEMGAEVTLLAKIAGKKPLKGKSENLLTL